MNRTEAVLSCTRLKLYPPADVERLREQFESAQPFPHLVLDGFFDSTVMNGLLADLPPLSEEQWVHQEFDCMVKWSLRSAVELETHAFQFVACLHSAGFLYFLSEITGVKALLPDPYLGGAGYHLVPEGGKFDVHVDRSTDFHCGLRRRLALVTFINKDWDPAWGGQLELWNEDGTACMKVIEPFWGRVVLMEIGDKNYHAVRQLKTGSGVYRKSFMTYFHTVDSNVVFHTSIFAPKLYQEKRSAVFNLTKQLLPPVLVTMLSKVKRWTMSSSVRG